MAITKGSERVTWSKPHKSCPSSDCSLRRAYIKLVAVVSAYRNVAVNRFAGLVQSAHDSVGVAGGECQSSVRKDGGAQVKSHGWGEVITW